MVRSMDRSNAVRCMATSNDEGKTWSQIAGPLYTILRTKARNQFSTWSLRYVNNLPSKSSFWKLERQLFNSMLSDYPHIILRHFVQNRGVRSATGDAFSLAKAAGSKLAISLAEAGRKLLPSNNPAHTQQNWQDLKGNDNPFSGRPQTREHLGRRQAAKDPLEDLFGSLIRGIGKILMASDTHWPVALPSERGILQACHFGAWNFRRRNKFCKFALISNHLDWKATQRTLRQTNTNA